MKIMPIVSWSKLLLFAGCYTVIYCIALFFFALKKEERTMILKKLRRA